MRTIRVHLDIDDTGEPVWWAEDDHGYTAVALRLEELKTLVYEAMLEFGGLERDAVELLLVGEEDADVAEPEIVESQLSEPKSTADGDLTLVSI